MKKFKIFIDENLPKQLAVGLNELQRPQNSKDGFEIEVLSIAAVFGVGTPDEDWIPRVGAMNGIVITQDFRIQTQKHQRQLYIKNNVGILFLNPPSKSGYLYWEMVKKLIEEWENIKRIVYKNKVPFAFRCTSKTSFVKME